VGGWRNDIEPIHNASLMKEYENKDKNNHEGINKGATRQRNMTIRAGCARQQDRMINKRRLEKTKDCSKLINRVKERVFTTQRRNSSVIGRYTMEME